MNEKTLRENLVSLLEGGQAHGSVERALTNLDPELRAVRPGKGELHSVWELLEHIRIAQVDILQYSVNPGWKSPKWPEGYWPSDNESVTGEMWEESVSLFKNDLKQVIDLALNQDIDLTSPIPHSPKHTYLREILLVADHNAYHAGQIIQVRKLLGNWP